MSQTPLGVTDPPWGHRPPLGWFESNEGGFQKLGRLSRHSNHHLLTWSLRDLRGFDREVMSEVDRELMGLGVSRVCNDGLGRKWKI